MKKIFCMLLAAIGLWTCAFAESTDTWSRIDRMRTEALSSLPSYAEGDDENMDENMIVGSVLVDKNGNRVEIVDAAARKAAQANAENIAKNTEAVNALNEENAKQDAALARMEIEGYERVPGYADVKNEATKHEGAYCYWQYTSGIGYTVKSVAIATWNWYEIPVQKGEKYRVTTAFGGTPAAVYLEEENGKTTIRYPEPTPSSLAVDTFEFEIPAGIVKMSVNEQPGKQALVLERASYDIPRFGKTSDYAHTSDHLWGKKLACVGDSITEATNPDGGYFTNYAEIVAARHGMTVYKDGKGGSTMSNAEGAIQPFCVERYLAVPEYDILTIWFGWNDNAYSTVGTVEDTTDTTFFGAYKKVLDHFISTYPTKKIGLIVPYGNGTAIQQAVRDLSELYGVPCLDLPDGKQCSLLWGTANDAQLARRAALTYDGTHPNQAGHEYLSTMYEEFIKRL